MIFYFGGPYHKSQYINELGIEMSSNTVKWHNLAAWQRRVDINTPHPERLCNRGKMDYGILQWQWGVFHDFRCQPKYSETS